MLLTHTDHACAVLGCPAPQQRVPKMAVCLIRQRQGTWQPGTRSTHEWHACTRFMRLASWKGRCAL